MIDFIISFTSSKFNFDKISSNVDLDNSLFNKTSFSSGEISFSIKEGKIPLMYKLYSVVNLLKMRNIFIYYTYIKYEIFLFKIINNIFLLNTNLKI